MNKTRVHYLNEESEMELAKAAASSRVFTVISPSLFDLCCLETPEFFISLSCPFSNLKLYHFSSLYTCIFLCVYLLTNVCMCMHGHMWAGVPVLTEDRPSSPCLEASTLFSEAGPLTG